jgi:3-carboxy-cis,cis-muconate cycloisomerase
MPVNPADGAVFGALYGSEAMRAIFDERAFFQRMLDVEATLAEVEAELGLIPDFAARAIRAAARVENLDFAALAASTRKVGYPVVGLVHALSAAAEKLAPGAGRYTHWGATTQDILDTAQILQIRDALEVIRSDLIAAIAAWARQAERHRQTVMAGRTHLQHAAPVTFGLKCAVWFMPLVEHLERLDALRPRLCRVQFGGAAGTLASLGTQGLAVMEALAKALELAAPPLPWHVARDGLAEAVSFLGLLTGSLGKIATDVILLAQTEVAELAEPYEAGRGGSSTMPQKRNPIASEYILAAMRGVQALVPLMQGAMAQDHERGTGPWQAEPLALPQAFLLSHGALLHMRALAEGLVVDAKRMRHNLELTGGLILAEAVMMGLAPHFGREEAHHKVKLACDRALTQRISLAEALAQDAAVRAKLDPQAIAELMDPGRYLGSTGAFIDRALAKARSYL